jgi:hypothetical protein
VSTQKFDLSLRLRHGDGDLTSIARSLGIAPSVKWNRGDPRRTPKNEPLEGTRDFSYCSLPFGVLESADLDIALDMMLQRIAPATRELHDFVKSGGIASIAIGWFCDGDTGAGISEAVVSKAADLRLSIDLYLYFSVAKDDERNH